MLNRLGLPLIIMLGTLGHAPAARSQERLHDYFNDTARQVQSTESPAQKREILSKNLSAMTEAVRKVKGAPLVSEESAAGLDRFAATLQERSDELEGRNGFARVPDDQLNAFSSYIVQDMEQADEYITISVGTLLFDLHHRLACQIGSGTLR